MVNKTELKQRAIYVYPPAEIAQRWKTQAEGSGASISKFVIEHVENSLNIESDPEYQPRTSLIDENRKLTESLTEQDKRVHHLELLVSKLEEDLRLYRSKLFADPDSAVIRDYESKLVKILMEPGYHDSNTVLYRLGVKPDNIEVIKAVSTQLETLQRFGLVRASSKGWMWII